MRTFRPPAILITWFRDQQGLALLVLLALVLGVAISKRERNKLIFGALIVAYAVLAFLTAVAIGASGGRL